MFKEIWQKIFPKKECGCGVAEQPLSDAPSGVSVQIKCLRGEEGVCQRLREMGFGESAIVEKVADHGTLICKVCDAKIAISKELAQNIIVKDVSSISPRNGKKVLLSHLSVGQKAVIYNFVVESDDCERIEEMGVTPGEAVEVIRYAPMGDPIEIKIRGYLLSLRKEEADLIQVELIS